MDQYSPKDDMGLFDLESENVEAGQAWAAAHVQEEAAARLCNAYPNAGRYCLNLRQHARESIRWREAALKAARQLKHRSTEGNHLGNLGAAYRALGQVERAIEYHEQALIIAQEICAASTEHSAEWMVARRGEGNALGNLGIAYHTLGQMERAIEYHQQALATAQEIGDRHREGTHLGNLGLAYGVLEQVERAIEYCQRALAIAQEIGDKSLEADLLTIIGWIECAYNENDDLAMSMVDEAISISTETKNASGLLIALFFRGGIDWILHKDQTARENWMRALSIALDSGYKPLEVTLRAYIALLDGEEGYQEQAREALSLSKQQWKEMNLSPQVTSLLQTMLHCIETGDLPQ